MSAMSNIRSEDILLLTARNAASYLSIAGTVVLLYDHILLFDYELRLIWTAKCTRWKVGFLLNRYIVPVCLIALAYQLSTISSETYTVNVNVRAHSPSVYPSLLISKLTIYSCKAMLTLVSLVSVISLGIVNFFVFHRIYAIWGYNKRLLQLLIPPYICVYGTAVTLSIYTILHDFIPHANYLASLKECIFDIRPTALIVAWSLLVILDIYLIILAAWNGLDRPRETNTILVKQLYRDGLGYFVISLTLRIFNIIVIGKLNLAYATLSVVASWSLITATVNRMLLVGTNAVSKASKRKPSYELDLIDTPFMTAGITKGIKDPNDISLAASNGIIISSRTEEYAQ